jgi:Domain of unknown function (DUF4389)
MSEIPMEAPGIPVAPGGAGGQPGPADQILVAFAEPADQRRLTVLVRLILAIPHVIVLWALGIAAEVVALICWFAALVTGRLPEALADFQVGYLRWATRFYAYLFLLTDEYPPFEFADADYPVRLRAQPGPLNRLAVLFRIILVIPAWIVSVVLAYGLSFLVMFVTWLIVLIAGRMPRPLHEALAAAVRYQARVSGYFLMLTAQYPGGLYGDPDTSGPGTGPAGGEFAAGPGEPAAPGWGQPGPEAAGTAPEVAGTAQPGPEVAGTAQPGWGPWGQPESAQPGYGAPAEGGPAEGAPAEGAPAGSGGTGYGQPLPGYGQPAAGYGQPAEGQPGYPAAGYGLSAAGYGQPAGPVGWLGGRQPWRLVLSRPARRLVTLFLVLGVILVVGYGVLIAVIAATSSNNTVTRAEATISVEAAFATLSSTLSGFDSKVAACQGQLSCVNKVDAQMSQAFGRFAGDMNGISMPTGASAAAAARVRSDASQASDGFTRLSKVTTAAQYQQVVASSGLETLLRRFDADYQDLGTTLGVR